MNSKDDITEYLKSHPRMIGVLFALMVALSQVGTAVAGGSYTDIGP